MTKRGILAVLVGLVVLGVAAVPASAQTVVLTATLTGGDENPGVVTGAFGNAEVTVDLARREIRYTVNVFNLPSGVTASHIHAGSRGVNGPVMINFTVTPNLSNDFGFSGTATEASLVLRPEQGIRSFDDAIQAIIGGATYVNVHSAVNGGGEIRGQLTVKP